LSEIPLQENQDFPDSEYSRPWLFSIYSAQTDSLSVMAH
jgi:hypothetical protein